MKHTVSFYVFASLVFPFERLHPRIRPRLRWLRPMEGAAPATSSSAIPDPVSSPLQVPSPSCPLLGSVTSHPTSSLSCELHHHRVLSSTSELCPLRSGPPPPPRPQLHQWVLSPAQWTSTTVAPSNGELPPLWAQPPLLPRAVSTSSSSPCNTGRRGKRMTSGLWLVSESGVLESHSCWAKGTLNFHTTTFPKLLFKESQLTVQPNRA